MNVIFVNCSYNTSHMLFASRVFLASWAHWSTSLTNPSSKRRSVWWEKCVWNIVFCCLVVIGSDWHCTLRDIVSVVRIVFCAILCTGFVPALWENAFMRAIPNRKDENKQIWAAKAPELHNMIVVCLEHSNCSAPLEHVVSNIAHNCFVERTGQPQFAQNEHSPINGCTLV